MTNFFQTTQTAVGALYGDFKFKPYYNVGFHFDAITTFIFHILRCIYNLVSIALYLLTMPLYVLNPLAWLGLPQHALDLADVVLGFTFSLIPIVVHPLIFTIRTLMSVIFGYGENGDIYSNIFEEQDDLSLAMTVF